MIHEASGRLGATSVWRRLRAADVAWLLVLLLIGALYLWRLDAWLINDDEGSYLYAAWRISLGELPYRDFLTPQLPAFLLPGGLLMRAFGPSALAARTMSVVLTLGAGVVVWFTARRLFNPLVAWITGTAFLLHPSVFLACRTYRPEPFMLLFASVGVLLFARGAFPRPGRADPPSRPWLAASGAAFALATLSKLFGPLAMAGCMLWLLADGHQRHRPLRAVALDAAVFVAGFSAVLVLGIGAFLIASPDVIAAVVGHHLRQGAGQPLTDVIGKGLIFYTQVLRNYGNGLLLLVSIAVAWMAWRSRARRTLLFGWQLPTLLGFLVLSRQLFPRHIIYLVPAMATLFAVGMSWLIETGRRMNDAPGSASNPQGEAELPPSELRAGARRSDRDRLRWLAAAVTAGLLVPWLISDWHHAWEWEAGTTRVADFVDLLAAPDELVLSDYSELNFYARRPTTHSAASMSAGAARSGQIGWSRPESPRRLQDELGGRLPRLLLLDTSEQYGHMRFLRDRGAFEEWVAENYGAPVGTITRNHQVYEVYVPRDRPLPVIAVFEGGPTLLAAAATVSEVVGGDRLEVVTAWQSQGPTEGPLGVTLRLVDSVGREWAQSDQLLNASGANSTRLRTTDEWRPGELVSDRVALDVPVGTPPGHYRLLLGLYDIEDLSPLGAATADGSALGTNVPVGYLSVEALTGSPAVPDDALDLEVDAELADGLRLLGRGPLPDAPVQAGQVLPIDLWLIADSLQDDAGVRVALANRAVGSVAASWVEPLGVPGSGTSTWPGGEVLFRQQIALPVMANAAGGTYDVLVEAVDEAGDPLAPGREPANLGAIEVTARDPSSIVLEPPAVGRRIDASFGQLAELYGVDVADSAAPGELLPVELVWLAQTTLPTPYKVTVQLIDRSSEVLAQHDAEPADWSRPTTSWLPGEYITDRHELALPQDLVSGSYRIVVAMYDPLTLQRLGVTGRDAVITATAPAGVDADGASSNAGDAALVGEIIVR